MVHIQYICTSSTSTTNSTSHQNPSKKKIKHVPKKHAFKQNYPDDEKVSFLFKSKLFQISKLQLHFSNKPNDYVS